MKLVEIYQCLCDETRLRMLHLLKQGPLCVCHIQDVLGATQVAVSKHLAYLRARGLVVARRHGRWRVYQLPEAVPAELDLQLCCLQDCVQTNARFQNDLKQLNKVRCQCAWLDQVAAAGRKPAAKG